MRGEGVDIHSGLRPSGKSDYPWDLPRANFSRQPLRLFTVCTILVFKKSILKPLFSVYRFFKNVSLGIDPLPLLEKNYILNFFFDPSLTNYVWLPLL